ncbi:MAG: FecR domain-containing protein, partial [Methylophilaceae bacterium]
AGAIVSTKEKSKVVIRFADGTTTELASNSQLKLDTMSLYSGGAMVDTKLRLQKGQLETHANPGHVKGNSIQVITPSAIAAVRGTKFRVTADQKATTQETLDGSVALSALGNEVAVKKGFGSKAEQGKPPIPPVVLLPAANTTSLQTQYDALPVTFDMPAMQGAIAWVGKVAIDAKLNQLTAEAEAQGSQLAFADMPDGEYYLNLRAKDSNGIAGYDALHQFTLNARPLQPVAVLPAPNGLVRDPQPTLQWSQVSEAQLYAVEIATDKEFKQIHESKRIEATEYKLAKNLTPGAYFWRVSSIAKNEHGQEGRGPAINVSQFTYKPVPPKPDISQLKVDVSRNRVTVKTISPPDGLAYQVSLDNEFNDQKQVWHGDGLGRQFDFLLKEYGKQTLYIKHIDSDGAASPAAVYEFNANPQ